MNLKKEIYKCDRKKINQVFRTVSPYLLSKDSINYFVAPAGREHYRLLSHLSNIISKSVIYDIGTYKGLSAIAMGFNTSNNVISYDVSNYVEVKCPNNVEFKIGNFYDDKNLLCSPFIFFDIDPHNGKDEEKFVKYLVKNNYKGVVLFDDIHHNKEMQSFWDGIKQEKVDLTDVGHWSGTGAVMFS